MIIYFLKSLNIINLSLMHGFHLFTTFQAYMNVKVFSSYSCTVTLMLVDNKGSRAIILVLVDAGSKIYK